MAELVQELAPLGAPKPFRHARDAVVKERRLDTFEPGGALVDQRLGLGGGRGVSLPD